MQSAGGKLLPSVEHMRNSSGDLYEIWATRVVVANFTPFVAAAPGPGIVETAARHVALLYLAASGQDVRKLDIAVEVVAGAGAGGGDGSDECTTPGRLEIADSGAVDQPALVGIRVRSAAGLRIAVDDPRGGSRLRPFHEPFAYCPNEGEVLLLPGWATVSVAYADPARPCSAGAARAPAGGCAQLDLFRLAASAPQPQGAGPGGPSAARAGKVLRSQDLVDKMLLLTSLGASGAEPTLVGTIVSGTGPMDLRPALPPYMRKSMLADLGITAIDLFGAWVLHISAGELARHHGVAIDVEAFNRDLRLLALQGIDHQHFKKLPRHERSENFFWVQQQLWQDGRRFPGFAESAAFQRLQDLFVAGAGLCLGLQGEEPDASLASTSFVWAAAIGHGEDHTEHFHGPGHLLSAAYYADAPEGSGSIYFADPRGPFPPFAGGFFGMTPRSGDFLFFPSWLRHGVKKSYFKKKGVRRVAYSMNLDGDWEATARVNRWRHVPLPGGSFTGARAR